MNLNENENFGRRVDWLSKDIENIKSISLTITDRVR